MFILLLDRASNTIGYAKISQGGVAGTYVDTKIIGKYVLDSLASAIVMCHNHPSGNLKPSTADHMITKSTIEMLNILDAKLVDHIIITEGGFYSMAGEGDI
jgi:DNA repair protein RadC